MTSLRPRCAGRGTKSAACLARALQSARLLLLPLLSLRKVLARDPLLALETIRQAAHDEVLAAGDEFGIERPIEVARLAAKEDAASFGRNNSAGADVPFPAANFGVEVELAGSDGAEVLRKGDETLTRLLRKAVQLARSTYERCRAHRTHAADHRVALALADEPTERPELLLNDVGRAIASPCEAKAKAVAAGSQTGKRKSRQSLETDTRRRSAPAKATASSAAG